MSVATALDPSRTASAARRRRKEARPSEIAAAALSVFTEKGYAATRLDEIADRAGVSKGTVYLYFDSKEALFQAAIEAAMTPAVEAAEALSHVADRSAPDLLRAFVHGWWSNFCGTPLGGLPKLMVAEAGNFPDIARWHFETMVRRVRRALSRIVELGIARGEFRPVSVDLAINVIFSPMFAIAVWQRAFGALMPDLPEPERFLDEAVTLLTHGLANPHPDARGETRP